MRIQMIALSAMFIFVFFLVPFPESDSVQRAFHVGSTDLPIVTVQSVAALEQSTSSLEPQKNAGVDDEPLISTLISDAVPDRMGVTPAGNRIIRETGFEDNQMGKPSEDIQETQISRSDQFSLTPKSSFHTTSIHSNTTSTRYAFGYNGLVQNRHPVMQRSNLKQPQFKKHVPSTALNNWNLPRNGQNNSLSEPRIPQQVDNEILRGTGQNFRRIHQQAPAPSVRPERRAAVSLIVNR